MWEKSKIHGNGVLTTEKISKGEKIMVFGGELVSREKAFSGKYKSQSIWMIDANHFQALPETDTADSLDEYLNHSCDANAWLDDEVTLIAKRDIKSGEEITLDQGTWNVEYSAYTDNKEFCACGAANCRQELTKDDWKLQQVQELNKGHFHPMIQKMIDSKQTRNQMIFDSRGNELVGTLYKAVGEERAALLILAGGANIPHVEGWYPDLLQALSEKGVTGFAFDFAGVGQSDGALHETSLSTRTEDARNALALLRQNTAAKKIYVMGISMGGPIAISVAVDFETDGLVLLVPAAYSLEARTKSFGPEFTAEIRRPGSWENSPEFDNIARYEGKVFLAFGTKDEVVPRGIYERYKEIVHSKGEVFEFESTGHKFMKETDPVSAKAREDLSNRLATFLTS